MNGKCFRNDLEHVIVLQILGRLLQNKGMNLAATEFSLLVCSSYVFGLRFVVLMSYVFGLRFVVLMSSVFGL